MKTNKDVSFHFTSLEHIAEHFERAAQRYRDRASRSDTSNREAAILNARAQENSNAAWLLRHATIISPATVDPLSIYKYSRSSQ